MSVGGWLGRTAAAASNMEAEPHGGGVAGRISWRHGVASFLATGMGGSGLAGCRQEWPSHGGAEAMARMMARTLSGTATEVERHGNMGSGGYAAVEERGGVARGKAVQGSCGPA